MSTNDRRRVFTGAPWEAQVGYCRAVRAGALVFVSGTAPVADDGTVVAPGDAYLQARRCFEIVVGALRRLGADPADVVRTRMYVTDASRWAEYGRAHAEAFGRAPPATAMVEVRGLIDPAMLIEVEADAVVRARRRPAKRTAARTRRKPK
jgi:enamine deaminase RidA (YjgF/YER057c/UK114 family)